MSDYDMCACWQNTTEFLLTTLMTFINILCRHQWPVLFTHKSRSNTHKDDLMVTLDMLM